MHTVLLDIKAKAEMEVVYAQAKLDAVNEIISKLEPCETNVSEEETTEGEVVSDFDNI